MKKNLTFEEDIQLALETVDRDVMLTANAGSGKTSCLVARYRHLLQKGFEPLQVMALTFTEKAAHEMKQRLLKEGEWESEINPSVISQIEKAFLGTFHHCYLQIWQESHEDSSSRWTILEEASILLKREKLLQKLIGQKIKEKDCGVNHLLEHFGVQRLNSILLESSVVLSQEAAWNSKKEIPIFETEEKQFLQSLQKIAAELENQFEKQLEENYFLTFDFLEKKVIELLKKNLIPYSLKNIQHLLVDEFQDCSPRQLEFLRLVQELPQQPKLFAVGDSKQSIYRFRDVEQKLIEKAQHEISNRNGLLKTLRHNYRSNANLVDFFNAYSSRAFVGAVHSRAQSRSDNSNSIETIQLGLDSEKMTNEEYLNEEASLVVEKIQDLQTQHSLSQIAVLFRTSNCTAPLLTLLKEKNIPYQIRGGQNLFEHQAIFDLENLIFFLANPQDEIALLGILRCPLFFVSDATLYWIGEQRSKIPLWDYLKMKNFSRNCPTSFPDESKKLNWIIDTLATLLEKNQHAASDLLQSFLKEIDGISLLSGAFGEENLRLDLYQWLHWLAKIEEENQCETLTQSAMVLKNLKNHRIRQTPVSDLCQRDQALNLLTIHAAKGLEFEVVFLFNLYRRPLPQSRWINRHGGELSVKTIENNKPKSSERYLAIQALEKQEEIEENKRLLYVAMTRARQKLFLFKGPEQNGSLQQVLEESLELPKNET